MGGGLNFLNKKTWHPARPQNLEEVWKREQKAAAEAKKAEELRKQLEEERKRSEFVQMAMDTGHLRKEERLDWMYGSGLQAKQDAEKRREDMLTGKAEVVVAPEQRVEETSRADQVALLPSFYSSATPASQNENWLRLNNDPLFAIKRQQQEQLSKLRENPIKMMELLKNLTKAKEKEDKKKEKKGKKDKNDKKSRKRERGSDSSGEEEGDGRAQKRSRSPPAPPPRHAPGGPGPERMPPPGGPPHPSQRHRDDNYNPEYGRPQERRPPSPAAPGGRHEGHREARRDHHQTGYGDRELHHRDSREHKRQREEPQRELSYRHEERRGDRCEREGRGWEPPEAGRGPMGGRYSEEQHRRERDGGRQVERERGRGHEREREEEYERDGRRHDRQYGRDERRRGGQSGGGEGGGGRASPPGQRREEQQLDERYGLKHSAAAPAALLRQADGGIRAAETRSRLEEARQAREEEERAKAAQRYVRRDFKTGQLTEEERQRRLAEMMGNADEHEAQRRRRLDAAAAVDAAEGSQRLVNQADAARGGDAFRDAAARDVFSKLQGSLEARVNSRRHFSTR